ncbi:hypothetical protein BVG16_01490 [Paenibacillus selenitireducens]|uniref:Lipoprotein n=1 Tax=Paenibacillus selenitireducens TaxID=1324314 RepID=A0A1T2XME8_9BACL|nr:hypothetical protein [Paenibacillus selenitireducens]OPA81044.1 hypothetical protein BVG16_01490 [Paenibacillus selenitireducens]
MRNKIFGIYLLLFMLIFSACTNVETHQAQKGLTVSTNQSDQIDTHAQILEVYTDLTKESGWWIVPKGVSKMTIHVRAKNTDTVLFWLVPSGTETWSERKLIGYDKNGSDDWSLKWEFGNRTLHDHIYVQALGSDGLTMDNKTINVTSVE